MTINIRKQHTDVLLVSNAKRAIKEVTKYCICSSMLALWAFSPASATAASMATPIQDVVSEVSSTPADEMGVISIEPLFEYPVAPEEMTGLQEKTDYLMQHFWDEMNFKSKKTVNQIALNDAFAVYCSAMPYASKEEVHKSVDALVKKLKKNPTLLLQFTMAAEENLYGKRATIWLDEIYLKFLDTLVASKKIDKVRKLRYADQRTKLQNSQIDAVLPFKEYTSPDGYTKKLNLGSTPVTLIEFGNPDCDDCRKVRNLLEVDLKVRKWVEDKNLAIAFILPEDDSSREIADAMSRYPENWMVGRVADASDKLDLRNTPSIWVLASGGRILGKNLTYQQAMRLIENTLSVTK